MNRHDTHDLCMTSALNPLSPRERGGVRADLDSAANPSSKPISQTSPHPNPLPRGEGTGMSPRTIAFTLIEMVVSLTIVSIVFLAMGSVMILAAKAVPDPDSPVVLGVEAGKTIEQIASELQVATAILAASANGIEFTVPDRDNDGSDETIKYKWNGSAADGLFRQYNGGTVFEVAPNLKNFELIYDTLEVTVTSDPVTSSEVVLASHGSVQNSKDYTIDDDHWIGQCLMPQNLPENALTWSPTRVYIYIDPSVYNIDGIAQVQLRQIGADDKPTNTVIEAQTMYETSIPTSYSWQGFTFSNVKGFLPDSCVALVLQWQAGNVACYAMYDNASGDGFFKTNNGGSTWSDEANESMVYYLYGTYTTPGATTTYNLLRSVSMTITPNTDSASESRSSVVVLNQPTMP